MILASCFERSALAERFVHRCARGLTNFNFFNFIFYENRAQKKPFLLSVALLAASHPTTQETCKIDQLIFVATLWTAGCKISARVTRHRKEVVSFGKGVEGGINELSIILGNG